MKKSILLIAVTLVLLVSSPFLSKAQDWSSVGDFVPEGASPEKAIEFEGDLIFCGEFTAINGEDMGHIIRWDGTSWSQMGNGNVTGDFKCIGVANGELFVGGVLIGADQTDQQAIYKWDGTNWIGTGNATDVGYPHAMTEWNGQLVVAVHGSGVNSKIQMYNGGTSWTQVGPDISDPEEFYQTVDNLAVYNDSLFIAGHFNNVGAQEDAQHIAKYDGQNWVSANFPLPSEGPNFDNTHVNAMEVHDGKLFAGGIFHDFGGEEWVKPSLAYYDGSTWSAFDLDPEYESIINSLESDGDNLFCGGSILYFDDGNITSGVVVFDEEDSNNFINLNFYNEEQPYSDVTDLTLVDGSIYASGQFFKAGPGPENANGVAKFNGEIPAPTAVNELNNELSLGLVVYPNPVTDFITVAIKTKGKITILNSLGAIVYEENAKNSTVIDVSNWDYGVYYIQYAAEGNFVTKKFVKM